MNDTRPSGEQRASLWKMAQQSGMTRRRFLSLLGIGGAGAVLAACGTQTAETPKDTPRDTPAPAGTPKPTRGKELNVAVESFAADIMDPTMMTTAGIKNLIGPIGDVFIAVDVNGKYVPGILTSWKVSDDHLSWNVEMRKGIKFHGGLGEAAAEDVKFTFERYMLPDSVYATKVASIFSKVEVTGPYTLRLTTKKPDTSVPFLLSAISGSPTFALMPKKYIEEKGIEAYRKAPIGTGPYQFKSYTSGSVVEFAAFDDYWGGPAGYDTFRVLLVPQESARIGLLRQGRAQVVEITPDGSKDVKAAGLEVLWSQGAAQAQVAFFGALHPQWKGKPTADARVRQALSLCINRKEMIDALLPGADLPNMPGITGAAQNVDQAKWAKVAQEKYYKYDLSEAKRLLAEAGYPNGFEYTLYTYPLSAVPTSTIATAVAGYWEKVGVKVKVVQTDQAAFQPWRAMDPPPPQLLGQASTYRSTAYPDLYSNMITLVSGKGGMLRLLNTGLTTSAIQEIDDLIDAAAAEFDPAKVEKINEQLMTKAADTWAVLPLAQMAAPYGTDGNVAVNLRPLGYITASLLDARPKK